MKNKELFLLLLFSFFVSYQKVFAFFYDSTKFPIQRTYLVGEIVVLDSLQFDTNKGYPLDINYNDYVYELADFLNKNQEWTVQVYVLMNTSYDTTSIYFNRQKANRIKEKLIYFNVNPFQFEVKDSVVSEFDERCSRNIAFRKTIVKFKEKVDYFPILDDLEQVYYTNDPEIWTTFFKNLSYESESAPPSFPNPELDPYKLDYLIDQFYEEFYKPINSSAYRVFPLNYEIEIGKVSKFVDEGYYDQEADFYWEGSTFIYSEPRTRQKLAYQYFYAPPKTIYLKEKYGIALEQFLQYEFSYNLDEMTNIPSNIEPIKDTKQKLEAIHPFIQPEYEDLFKGRCNAHTFWEFHWDFQDSFSPKMISIDEASKMAYIAYKDEHRETRYASYVLKDGNWEFVETIETGQHTLTPWWRYIAYGSLVLAFLAMAGVTIYQQVDKIYPSSMFLDFF